MHFNKLRTYFDICYLSFFETSIPYYSPPDFMTCHKHRLISMNLEIIGHLNGPSFFGKTKNIIANHFRNRIQRHMINVADTHAALLLGRCSESSEELSERWWTADGSGDYLGKKLLSAPPLLCSAQPNGKCFASR